MWAENAALERPFDKLQMTAGLVESPVEQVAPGRELLAGPTIRDLGMPSGADEPDCGSVTTSLLVAVTDPGGWWQS